MSSPNQTSAYLHNLNARLHPLKRPAFLASAVGLLLVGLFVWKYWNDPQWFNAFVSNQGADSKSKVAPNPASENLLAKDANPSPTVGATPIDQTNPLASATLPSQKYQLPNLAGSSPLTPLPTLNYSQQEPKIPNLRGTYQQKLNASNPVATSTQKFSNTRPVSKSNRFINLPIASATAVPVLGANSPYFPRISQGAVPSSFPNINTATASNFPTMASGTQTPINVSTQALPTPAAARQMLFGSASASGMTNSNASGTQIPSGSASASGMTNSNASGRQIPTRNASAPGSTRHNTSGREIPAGLAAAPEIASYNASLGQLPSMPATAPGVTAFNASSMTPAAPLNSAAPIAPSQPTIGAPAAVRVTPIVAVRSSNAGQEATQLPHQTSEVTNPGFDAMLKNPGLQSSQASLPTFTAPPVAPGSDIWGMVNTLSR